MTRKKDYKHEHPEGGVVSEESEPNREGGSPGDAGALKAELDRARAREDELLRAVAELTNVNRRRKQDMDTIAQLSQESLVKNILPVLDDIDRALLVAQERKGDPFHAGLLMIRERLWQTLQREGLETIEAQGAPFDPELHEAVATRPGEGGTVLEVVVPGYKLRGRVLRHAKVIVAGQP